MTRIKQIDRRTGLADGVVFTPSPNWDERPPDCVIEALIVHAISLPPGEFGGPAIDALFCNRLDPSAHPYYQSICALRVSAHFLIRRAGDIVQYVPVTKRAWHAGKSSCLGRTRVNDFSVGVELEGCDGLPFDAPQYESLVELTRALCRAFPALGPDRVFGHSDIAPGRKTDPGPCFDWLRYKQALLR